MKILPTVMLATIALPLALLADEKPGVETKPDALLVYGKGFLFAVKEPSGWVADTENASKFGANIIFSPAAKKEKKGYAMIRVLVAKKVDEDTEADLAHDMTGYKSQFPKIKFEDITVTHPSYRVFPKLFTVPDEFYEYVVYLNPGPKSNQMFSASMNKQKTPASKEELSAYQEIISSLTLLSNDRKKVIIESVKTGKKAKE